MMRYPFLMVALLAAPLTGAAEEVLVCQHGDGHLSITHWATDDHAVPASMAGLPCATHEASTLPPDRSRRDAWRLQPDGQVVADPTVETVQERVAREAQEQEPVEIPLSDFGAGVAGAAAALGGQQLLVLARRKKETPNG